MSIRARAPFTRAHARRRARADEGLSFVQIARDIQLRPAENNNIVVGARISDIAIGLVFIINCEISRGAV